MTRGLAVHLLPDLVEPAALRGGVVIVIDNLRASVTITAALASGARRVLPAAGVDEAVMLRDRIARETPGEPPPLLGGERSGVLIPGFDLDNSPDAYSPARVRGRTVVFTTTNGTRAIRHSEAARLVVVGSLTNLSAVCALLEPDPGPFHVVCAGTGGSITLDDCIPAGAFAQRLSALGSVPDDSGVLCLRAWEASRPDLARAMGATRGGRGLTALGLGRDIERCCTLDVFSVVPRLVNGELVLGKAGDS